MLLVILILNMKECFFKLNFLFYTIKLSIKFSDIEKIKNYKELENFVINKKFEIIGKVMK